MGNVKEWTCANSKDYDDMKKLIYSFLYGWYHGRGGKCFQRGKFEEALKYYEMALIFAKNTNNEASIALEAESIAHTLVKLERQDSAVSYAQNAIEYYNKLKKSDGDFFDKAVDRVKSLVGRVSPADKDAGFPPSRE